MTLPIAIVKSPQPIATTTDFLKIKPNENLIEKLIRKVFGFILRLSVFQLGEYQYPLSYYLMRLFQIVNCDPRERAGINLKRLEESKNLLRSFGGIEGIVYPEDGEAEIHYMSFTPERALARIREMGGEKRKAKWIDSEGKVEWRDAIFPATPIPSEQFHRLVYDLKKFGLPFYEQLEDSNGAIQPAFILPEGPQTKEGETPCILRLHSPGRGMVMDRKFLRWVFAGCSAYIMDPRGTLESRGTPSEGGYYLDADAVFKKILRDGHPYEQIYVSGYCEGAAIGAWLIKKYHHLGIHFIAENPFNSLYDMVKGYNRLGKWTANYIFPEILSHEPSIISKTSQDGFNNETKLRGLAPSKGKFILMHSHCDRTNPPDSIQKLEKAIGNEAGPLYIYQRIHPNPRFDAHMQPPSECEKAWKWIAKMMSA